MAVGVQPGSRHASVTGHCTKRGSAPMDEHHQEASPILPWSATSARTHPRCALRFLLLRRLGGSCASWSSADKHPSAVAGSPWPRSNWRSLPAGVSTGAFSTWSTCAGEVGAWESECNARGMLIHWRLIIADARDRLGRLCRAKSS